MSKYITEIRQKEEFPTFTQKTLQISKRNQGKITLEEVMELAVGLEKIGEKQGEHVQMLIRGLGPDRMHTLKGFDEDLKTLDDYEEYFNNNVKDTVKFESFYQLQITIFSTKNKKLDRKDVAHYKVDNGPKKKVNKKVFDKKKK
jgi:hypothetical protein